ncbi:MAG: dihydrofolate reductase family protein [Calditrichia bacterium]
MRKVVLFIACSLDNYIAGKNHEIDWLFTDRDYGYDDFIAGVDTVIMGRKTYDVAQSFGEYPYPDQKGIVFSRSKAGQKTQHVTFVDDDIAAVVQSLKAQPGKDIWLVGGAQLTMAFLQQNLIDEFVISVHPVLLGDGIPLFPAGFSRQDLAFENCQIFNTGLVQLTYSRR